MIKTSPTEQGLRRIFSLVPLIYYHQGIPLEKLQKMAGFANEKELRKSLERLMMFGVPPFSPSDFISVHIDDRQQAWLDFPLGLERPLALSSSEWTTLQKMIRKELEYVSQDDLGALPLRALLGRLSEVPVVFEADDQVVSQRNLIEEAMQDKLQIELSYRSLSSKQGELRRLEPWLLFCHYGTSYMIAYCHTRQAPRCFLLERMQNLAILEQEQQHPIPENVYEHIANFSLFKKEPSGFQVKIAFAPQLLANLRSLLQLYDVQAWSGAESPYTSWLEASFKVQDSIWLCTTLRGIGDEVMLLEPKHLRESYAQELSEILVPELL